MVELLKSKIFSLDKSDQKPKLLDLPLLNFGSERIFDFLGLGAKWQQTVKRAQASLKTNFIQILTMCIWKVSVKNNFRNEEL